MATWPTITDDDGSNTTGTVLNNTNVWTPIQSYIGGAWTTQAFNAANFSQDTGTWTVASGDVSTNDYIVIGKTMIWNLNLATTTVASNPVELRCTIPAGATAQTSAYVTGLAIINGTAEFIRVDAPAGATYVRVQRVNLAAWSASTDNTYVLFQIAIEIP